MKRQRHLLTSVGFLIGLFLLLINDFILKEAFHNAFTGKVSDFAGMFIFPLFWLALFPRYRRMIFMGSALFFVWWKSPLSQAVIDAWNAGEIFQIGRVVDYSDLWALLMLPVAWWYTDFVTVHVEKRRAFSLHPIVPICVACFAFVATTRIPKPIPISPPQIDSFNFSVDSLKNKIYNLASIELEDTVTNRFLVFDSSNQFRRRTTYVDGLEITEYVPVELAVLDSMEIRVLSAFSYGGNVAIRGDSISSRVILYSITSLSTPEEDVDLLLGDYNEVVIETLRK